MKNILKFLAVLLVITNIVFAGGGSRNGTGGASQLLIPVGARGIAMSGSSLTSSSGLEALYWNPANLVTGPSNTNVMFSYMNHIADIGVNYFAVSTNIEGFGAIGASLKSLSIGEINITTVENPDGTGQSFTPQFYTLGLTYSRMLSDRISVGLTMNYISEQLDLVGASGVAFNVGINYKNLGNIDGLVFAIVLKNLGPQMKYDGSGLYTQANPTQFERLGQQYFKLDAAAFDLPSTLEIGMGYQYNFNESNKLLVDGVYQNTNFYGDEYKFGLEYGFNNTFFVRGGYMLLPEMDKDENIYGITAGAGINYNLGGTQLKLDYAFRDVDFFDANHVLTIQLGF